MINIKGYAIANDGAMRRIAVTYDVIDEEGKAIKSNVKVNRIITEPETLDAVAVVDNYVKSIIEE